MREILRLREQPRPGMHKGDLMKFEKAFKGIKVEPTHRGGGVIRRYKVMGLSRTPADKTFFEGENGRISVAEYFQCTAPHYSTLSNFNFQRNMESIFDFHSFQLPRLEERVKWFHSNVSKSHQSSDIKRSWVISSWRL